MPFFNVKPEYQHAALICSGLVLSLLALLVSLIGNSFLRARIGIASVLVVAACVCAGLSAARDETHMTVGAVMTWCMGGLTAWLSAAQLKEVRRKKGEEQKLDARKPPHNR